MHTIQTRDQTRGDALGRGVYGAAEAVRLVNFRRRADAVSRRTLARWLRGYTHDGEHSPPLWQPDYCEEEAIEVSFRDLVELRFVKAFRDLGLSLPTIRQCFERAVEEVKDARPFSTQRFRTDGKTIFLEITDGVREGKLIDLRHRQGVFHRVIAPSLHGLEFDANIVSRWYPSGKTIVLDPARSFGRPIVAEVGIPTSVLAEAAEVEGSPERVAKLYELPVAEVRDAIAFERQLAA
jgi:uncharacterized protein (DUF433 family)